MNENVSVEGTCCTHSLNETLRCVIRFYSSFAAVMRSRIWANSSLPPARHVREGFLCTEGFHNRREHHATSRMTFHRETRHHSYPQTAWENPFLRPLSRVG